MKLLEPCDLAGQHQVLVRAQRDAVLLGEGFRPLPDKIYVRAFAEHLAGRPNRIGDALDTTDSSRPQRVAIHHQGV